MKWQPERSNLSFCSVRFRKQSHHNQGLGNCIKKDLVGKNVRAWTELTCLGNCWDSEASPKEELTKAAACGIPPYPPPEDAQVLHGFLENRTSDSTGFQDWKF